MKNDCPKCGSIMVEKPSEKLYLTDPPQWDCVMWCNCGYTEDRGRIIGKTKEELLKETWDRAQSSRAILRMTIKANLGDSYEFLVNEK